MMMPTAGPAVPADEQSVRIDLLSATNQVRHIIKPWLELAAAASTCTPYNHPGWIFAWWDSQRAPDTSWHVAACWDASQTLVGVLPLVRSADDVLRFAADGYQDVSSALAVEDLTTSLWSAAILGPHGTYSPAACDLATLGVPDLYALRRLSPPGFRITGMDPGAYVDLSSGWEAVWERLSPQRRKRWRAEWRQLRQDHGKVEFDIVQGHRAVQAINELWLLREQSWLRRNRYHLLASHARGARLRRFLTALATSREANSLSSVARLVVANKLVASALLLHVGSTVWYPFTAFDPDVGCCAPGRLLLAHCVHWSAENGAKRFELGRGVEDYKFSVGALRYELANVVSEPGGCP